MPPALTGTVSHVGLCVGDLEQSRRFYCDGLGFVEGDRHRFGDELSKPLEVEAPVELVSQFVRKGSFSIELLGFGSPRAAGAPAASRATLGLTHLSLVVDDLDAAVAGAVAAGGTALPDTAATVGDPPVVRLTFVADPDGVRIELMQLLAG